MKPAVAEELCLQQPSHMDITGKSVHCIIYGAIIVVRINMRDAFKMRGYYLFAYINPGGFNSPVSNVC